MLIGNKYSGYSKDNIRLYFDPVTIMATATAAETAAVVTAAEIAAAEAAAIAAAEAAAVASAEAAAVQAAQAAAATAAETGAITAAEAGAAQAAQQAGQAGIMEIGGTTAAQNAAPLTTAAEVNAAATQSGLPPGFEQQLQNIQNYMQGPSVDVATTNSTGGMEALQNLNAQSAVPSTAGPEAMSFDSFGNPVPVSSPAYSSADPTGLAQMSLDANAAPSGPSTFDKLLDYADKNPFKTGAAMYMGASKLGLLDPSQQTFNDDPYDGPLSKYRMSPDFQGRTATPNIYRPTYPTYAAGGIMNAGPVQSMSDQNNAMGYQQAMAATGGQVANFAKGGNLSDSLDYYKSMMGSTKAKAPNEPGWSGSAGIARDDDPDTRSRDALTAAQIRNAKVNKRANLSIPNMKRPTPMGQINLAAPGIKGSGQQEDVQEAAGGGIMGASSLGGYAAGGNPRLLRGPGDGMSDNIPATIGKKQPARLADGEFVIPADVVSHLGNGSTEAGAKRLHEMMSKVRRDRTGNSKQGKQIVAAKYMPK